MEDHATEVLGQYGGGSGGIKTLADADGYWQHERYEDSI